MSRINKKVLFITIVSICSLLFASCEDDSNKNSSGISNMENSSAEKILAHMNATYDDVFEYQSTIGGQAGSKETQILMRSEKFPNKEIWGWYSDETKKFKDNYISVKYHEQSTEKVGSVLKDLFGDSDFVYEVNVGFHNTYELREFSFDEYISSNKNGLGFTVTVDSTYIIGNMNDFKENIFIIFENISMPKTSIIAFSSNADLFSQLKNGEITKADFVRLERTAGAYNAIDFHI